MFQPCVAIIRLPATPAYKHDIAAMMNTGDLLSESDWEMFLKRDPDVDQSAWNYGTNIIDEFFAPNAPFWADTNTNGELIASDVLSQFRGQAGSGVNTGGGTGSGMQIDNGIDFLPTVSSSEVLDAVVSTNQQSFTAASLDPTIMSPSLLVSDAELPATERAEISNMSSSSLPPSVFIGGQDHDLTMTDSSPLPCVRATTPPTIGREGAQPLLYGTDGTAGRTPHSAQQSSLQVPDSSTNAPAQTFRATPNMAATAALYSSSPYDRSRHTRTTEGAESLRRDMEQHTIVLPSKTAAIPFHGLKAQDTTPPTQETAKESKPASTPVKATKKRTTRKSGLTIETAASSTQETTKANEPSKPPTSHTKQRPSTRKPKAAIENQMFAVLTPSDNGAPIEKLAKGSELGFKSPAPKTPKRKAPQPEPMRQQVSGGASSVQDSAAASKNPKANKKARVKDYVSSREVQRLTGVEVKEGANRRKTRSSLQAGGEMETGPDAGRAVRERRQGRK